jgi:hypothetical protein
MVDKVDVRNVVLCAGVLLLLTTPALTAGNYDNLPLVIEPNEGLAGPGVDFVSRGPGYTLLLSRQGATFNPSLGNPFDFAHGGCRCQRVGRGQGRRGSSR